MDTMKPWKKRIIAAIISAAFIVLASTSGCSKKVTTFDETFIRYQRVDIPGEVRADHEARLNDKNIDIQANAIFHLIPYAREYAKAAFDTGASKEKTDALRQQGFNPENSRRIIDTVLNALKSQNEKIKTACLIFITEISEEYPDKTALLNHVIAMETKNPETRYEQLNTLMHLYDAGEIPPSLIKNCLEDNSWSVKTMTYLLLGKIPSEPFHQTLIKHYQKAEDGLTKIAILQALKTGFGEDIFIFLTREMTGSGADQRIQFQCASLLKAHHDDNTPPAWLVTHHRNIQGDTLKAVMNSYIDEIDTPKGNIFFKKILKSGEDRLIQSIDKTLFFDHLYAAIKDKNESAEQSELEAIVLDSAILGESFKEFQARRKAEEVKREQDQARERYLRQTMLPAFNRLLEGFLDDARKLFNQGGMEPGEVEETVKDIKELLELTEEGE